MRRYRTCPGVTSISPTSARDRRDPSSYSDLRATVSGYYLATPRWREVVRDRDYLAVVEVHAFRSGTRAQPDRGGGPPAVAGGCVELRRHASSVAARPALHALARQRERPGDVARACGGRVCARGLLDRIDTERGALDRTDPSADRHRRRIGQELVHASLGQRCEASAEQRQHAGELELVELMVDRAVERHVRRRGRLCRGQRDRRGRRCRGEAARPMSTQALDGRSCHVAYAEVRVPVARSMAELATYVAWM